MDLWDLVSKTLITMELAKIINREGSEFIAGVREEPLPHYEVRQRSKRCVKPLFLKLMNYRLELAKMYDEDLEDIITKTRHHGKAYTAVELFYDLYLEDNRYQKTRKSLICLPMELRNEVEKSFELLDAWYEHYWSQDESKKEEIKANIQYGDLSVFLLKILFYLEANLERAADDLGLRETIMDEIPALEYH
jgi:hypothetical protein